MRLAPIPEGGLRLRLDLDEARLLNGLVSQLTDLLQSHSLTALDPDPLFASLEVGGSDSIPADPALARLFPNAFDDETESANFRKVTEQGLLNRKLQDALEVSGALGISEQLALLSTAEKPEDGDSAPELLEANIDITSENMLAWVRTLTSLRLAIAARIGIDIDIDSDSDSDSDSDTIHEQLLAAEETRGTVVVYDWLAAILDTVLRMVEH